MPSQAALLIGSIAHARKEWDNLSSILTLKVVAKTPFNDTTSKPSWFANRNSLAALGKSFSRTARPVSMMTLPLSTGRMLRIRYFDLGMWLRKTFD